MESRLTNRLRGVIKLLQRVRKKFLSLANDFCLNRASEIAQPPHLNRKINDMKTTILPIRNSISRSPLRLGLPRVQPIWIVRGFLLIPLVLGCFALSPMVQAVTPAPDGGYTSNNTAEGQDALLGLTTGTNNTATGFDALFTLSAGSYNTATGSLALKNNTASYSTADGYKALFSNTSGSFNTATGYFALSSNTTGTENTAAGMNALKSNTTGRDNTANGFQALFSNKTISGLVGNDNTATGSQALFSNTTGGNNTATGFQALLSNQIGSQNTANGSGALHSNIGSANTATGYQALYNGTDSARNTANGVQAMFNTFSTDNVADGYQALYSNTSGNTNTASGSLALNHNVGGNSNTATGYQALVNNGGSGNIAVGATAGENLTTGNNNIDIGNLGVAAESATIRIGSGSQTATYIAGIYGVVVAGEAVRVTSSGQVGVLSSSARFKDEIKPMEKASETILALKPVSFRYKKEIDPERTPQFGLVAEEVAKVDPDLVARDCDGKPFTVRYDAVNAMLLNEFLKAHGKIQEQQATITQLKSAGAKQEATITDLKQDFQSKLAEQQKQIKALTSGLQKVSVELEASKPAPQMVSGNQ